MWKQHYNITAINGPLCAYLDLLASQNLSTKAFPCEPSTSGHFFPPRCSLTKTMDIGDGDEILFNSSLLEAPWILHLVNATRNGATHRQPPGHDFYHGQLPHRTFHPFGGGGSMPWLPQIWVFPKIGGKPPKMDGENNGKAYENGWFGGKTHYFRKQPFILVNICILYSRL